MASEQIKLIDASGWAVRGALIVLLLLALFGSWRALRWYAGGEIALAAPNLPEGALDAAQTSARLSPDDALAHWALANLLQRGVGANDLQAAIAEYKMAVSLSPQDFRLWTDLGRALEKAGDEAASEKALRRAVELAPYYSWPRWHLGNFLLRRGRYTEAVAELRRVAEIDPDKRGAVIDLTWAVYGGDVKAIREALGDSTAVQADFIVYLLGRKRLDEAVQVWSGFSAEQKREADATGRVVIDGLIAAKNFRAALSFSRELSGAPEGGYEVGRISNGSFEKAVAQEGAGLFDWHVQSVPKARVALEPDNAHEGRLSLRINFNAPDAVDLNLTQLIAVEPASGYRLTFYVRASDLKSAATTLVRVVSASDGKVLAESAQVPTGKSDWQKVTLDFKTPPDVDGITLSISRAQCAAEGGVCPIFGTVWYDDFNLQFAGRDAGARTTGKGK
ncbi:MAG: tetratricopeptide repeat protein [Pyrinomonadaceae bacterium]|nr:tetratricopeptide repeat protein [Pyrinomonadaceae bacterium]